MFNPGKTHTHLLEAALADPQIATIRKVRGPVAFVLGAGLCSLREVSVEHHYQSQESLRPVLRADRALPFVSLDGWLDVGDDALLDACTCLPNLTRLGLAGRNLARAATRELARRVAWLELQRESDLEPLFAVLRVRTHGTLSVSNDAVEYGWSASLAVTHTDAGRVAKLSVSFAPETQQGSLARAMEYAQQLLAGVRAFPITALEVHSTKAIRQDATREWLRENRRDRGWRAHDGQLRGRVSAGETTPPSSSRTRATRAPPALQRRRRTSRTCRPGSRSRSSESSRLQ